MALKPCPECTQPVSSQALRCPQCGYPVGSRRFALTMLVSIMSAVATLIAYRALA